jgi:hypothetical protein
MRLARDNPDWAIGFEDETWWSRVAQPALNSWTEAGKPLRLVEQLVAKDDPDPKAISLATGFFCRSLKRCGCALWMVGP